MHLAHKQHRRSPWQFMTAGLLFCLLVSPAACTKPASALKSNAPTRSAAMPTEIARLPGSPLAVFYMKSPEKTLTVWASRVLGRLGNDSTVRDWVEKQCMIDGKPMFAGCEGPVVVGVYGNPQTDVRPTFVVLAAVTAANAMGDWLLGVLGAESMGVTQRGDVSLERFAVEGDEEGWYRGQLAGFTALSNDPEMLVQISTGVRGTAALGPFQTGWNFCATLDPDVFMTVDLRQAVKGIRDPIMAQAFGVAGVKGLTYAFKDDGERLMDSLYVHTPAPHKGLIKIFDGERLADKVIRQVPSECLSFMMLTMDLRSLWQDMRANLPAEVGGQANMIEQQLGFKLDQDLFGSVGSAWTSYGVADSSAATGLGSVLRIPMRDHARFMACLQKLTAGFQMRLEWKPGPDGFRLLSLPTLDPSMAPLVAAGEKEWVIASSQKAFAAWQKLPAGGQPSASVSKLASRYGGRATWLAFADASALRFDREQIAQLGDLRQMMPTDGAGSFFGIPSLDKLPWDQIERSGQKLLGDMVFAVAPNKDGIEFCFESSCGLFPFLGLGAIIAVRQKQEAERVQRLRVIEARIALAQSEFRGRHGRFARNLWELRDASLIDQGLASGVESDLLYRIESDGRRWRLEFREENSASVFLLDDGAYNPANPGAEKGQ